MSFSFVPLLLSGLVQLVTQLVVQVKLLMHLLLRVYSTCLRRVWQKQQQGMTDSRQALQSQVRNSAQDSGAVDDSHSTKLCQGHPVGCQLGCPAHVHCLMRLVQPLKEP